MTCQTVATASSTSTTTVTSASRSRSSSPVHKITHRDQHQIRHRLLHRLGIDKPSITMGTVRTIPKLSTNNCTMSGGERSQTSSDGSSYHMALQQDTTSATFMDCSDGNDLCSNRKIRFAPTVQVQEIPSHADYSQEDRDNMWMSTKEIEVNAKRNRLEYLADGCDYTKATEENRMMRWRNEDVNGKVKWEWIHPATYWLRYQQEQDRILLEEHQELFTYNSNNNHRGRTTAGIGGPCSSNFVKSTDVGMGMETATASIPMKKSPTVTSLTGMAA